MQVSDNGIELIKDHEGLRLEAYQDIAGIWTIGYGDTGPHIAPGMRITKEAAIATLKNRLVNEFLPGVLNALKRSITQNQLDAYVSLAYNIGVGSFAGSTTVKRFNRGDIMGAAEAIRWWSKATVNGQLQDVRGLEYRRDKEVELFLTPDIQPVLIPKASSVEIIENVALAIPPARIWKALQSFNWLRFWR